MKKGIEESRRDNLQAPKGHSRSEASQVPAVRPLTVLLFGLAHYGLLLLLAALIFFASHLPPKAVNVDGVIMVLFQAETVLTAPRKLLLWLWPGESTPGLLSVLTTFVNSLAWGCALAGGRALWAKVRH